ncbi:unnamed protein product, partial [Adineta ricciae]
MRRVNK